MTERKSLSPRRKRDIAKRRNWIAGHEPLCLEAGQVVLLSTGKPPEYDHIHALGMGGSDDIENMQPMTPGAHKAKTRDDSKARGKIRRLTGANKPKRKFNWPKGRKLGWDGLRKKLNGKVEARV